MAMRKKVPLHHLCLAIVLFACVLFAATARAQSVQDRRWCEGEDAATAEQRISACSAVIRSGRERGEKLAEAYHHRGHAYALKSEDERANQDYASAIRLNSR